MSSHAPPAKAGYHHGDLRNAILEASLDAIEELGMEAFSLREAARRVGVSATAAYRHFADREALLNAAAGAILGRMGARMQVGLRAVPARASRANAIERLRVTGRAYVEFALAHPEHFRLLFGREGRAHPPVAESGCADTPDPFRLLAEALDGLVEVGALAPSLRPRAEWKAWTVVHGYAGLAIAGALPIEGALEALLDFVLSGLGVLDPASGRAKKVERPSRALTPRRART